MSGNSWGLRGSAAISEATRSIEVAKQRKQRKALNFRLAKNEAAEVIILDENLDCAFGLWEQTIPGPDPSKPFVGQEVFVSPKSKGWSDPLEESKRSFAKYVLYLTVLDLRPYTNETTGKHYPFTRKLLPIKAAQKDDLLRKLKKRQDKNGKLRGLHMQMVRGSDNMSAAIGSPEELETGEYGFLTEEEIIQRFGHPEIKSQAGQVVVPANGNLQAINYEENFTVLTPEEVRRMFGLGGNAPTSIATPGQNQNQSWDNIATQDLGEVPEFLTEDDIPF